MSSVPPSEDACAAASSNSSNKSPSSSKEPNDSVYPVTHLAATTQFKLLSSWLRLSGLNLLLVFYAVLKCYSKTEMMIFDLQMAYLHQVQTIPQ